MTRIFAVGELMASRTGSVDPRTLPDEVFELYSIPAHDAGEPVIAEGTLIGSSKQVVREGDVLLSKIVPHIRRSCIVGENRGFRMIASGEWIILRHPAIEPRYLKHLVISDSFHHQFMSTVSGIGGSLMRARPAFVARIRVAVPSIAEQRRIADILDRADSLSARWRTSTPLMENLGRAVFQAAVGTSSGDWPRLPLGSLAKIVRGASPRPAGDPRYFGGSVPWLKISDVTRAQSAYVHQIKETVTDAGVARSVLVRAGTLILTNSATVGIAKFLGVDCCIHDGFLAFLDVDSGLDPTYLYWSLTMARDALVALAPQGTQRNLNTKLVKTFHIPVPPLSVQKAVTEKLLGVEDLQNNVWQQSQVLDDLSAALKHRAFAGQL